MTAAEVSWYASHTKVTDPGSMTEILKFLSKGIGAIPELMELIQGLFVHIF
ncbi:MAG: hypothetical protein IMF26_00090 [Candidatus Fermentithermobacillus carboniphilus]|uniref:Uncharacterized protein n=1 Tax=Candidatus Fermentithermobacillus carboniphilus TaxID=3085328 RepID=A0AAT9LBR9_9FIRM|nr:MAG: hypothetical protein IMF26_00090 [Candidatus Fermentithermobacillus carboniphilus]